MRLFRTPRRPSAKRLIYLLIVLLAGGYGAIRHKPADAVFKGPFHAVDGDTLTIDGSRMRLRGMDAPERKQQCGEGASRWNCGLAATRALQGHVDGNTTCTAHGTDKYRRRLIRCTGRGGDIAAAMVRDGQAVAYGAYTAEEAEARKARRGLWSGPFQRPEDWRKAHKRLLPADEREEGRKRASTVWDWSLGWLSATNAE